MLRKIESRKRRGLHRRKRLDGIIDSKNMNLNKFWEIVKDRGAWSATVYQVTESNMTELLKTQQCFLYSQLNLC